MEDEDLGFVFDCWGRSLRPCYGDVLAVDYLDGLRAHLSSVLEGAVTAWVSHPPGSPSFIIGWLIGSPPHRVDYVYTRGEYRKNGAARRILAHAGYRLDKLATYSRLTTEARNVCRNHGVTVLPRF